MKISIFQKGKNLFYIVSFSLVLSECSPMIEKHDYSYYQPADTILSSAHLSDTKKDTTRGIMYQINREQALRIGYEEALRLKFISKDIEIIITEQPIPWNDLFSDSMRTGEPNYKYWEKIKNTKFWRLLYIWRKKPRITTLGALELFIDAFTGEVIYKRIHD